MKPLTTRPRLTVNMGTFTRPNDMSETTTYAINTNDKGATFTTRFQLNGEYSMYPRHRMASRHTTVTKPCNSVSVMVEPKPKDVSTALLKSVMAMDTTE